MQLTVTGRHFEITEPLRQHVESKMDKISRYIDDTTDTHVVLSVEKHRHSAEITLQSGGAPVRCLEERHDMYEAFDEAFDKVERQIKRLKEKGSRKGRAGSKEIVQVESENEGEDAEVPLQAPQIIRSPRMAAKPMGVDEAAMQLGLTTDDFLVFSNSATNQMNVMYKRRDGNYGLIEPEF